MNEYFVDGDGIAREVIQSEVTTMLGTDAICRPAEHNGIRGYKVKAYRPFTSVSLRFLLLSCGSADGLYSDHVVGDA